MTAAIFWDTNLFIYLIERRPVDLHGLALRARKHMVQRGDQLVTSSLTVGEILVHPLRSRRPEVAKRYAELIAGYSVVVPFDGAVAWKYAEIRALNPTVRPPDAVQLACAADHGVTDFVTNDQRLQGLAVDGIGRITALGEANS